MQILSDSLIIFRRQMDITFKNKISIVIGMTQPILYLVLFAPMLGKAIPATPGHNAWQSYVPGLLVQLGLFGAGYAGFNLIPDMRAGVIERMRVTPVSRLALLLGRVMRDTLVMCFQAVLLTLVAVAFGLRAPLLGVVCGFVLVLVLAISLASLSYLLAMSLPTEYLFAPVLNTAALPLLLLSGILLPITARSAPAWLNRISDVNPLKHIVEGIRAVFRGELTSATAIWAYLLTAALVAVGLWYGTRTFRRDDG